MNPRKHLIYVLAFAGGFYRFGACDDLELRKTVQRVANACPIQLRAVYTALLPGFAFGALVELLAESALQGLWTHGDWIQTDAGDQSVLARIAAACSPDQIALSWDRPPVLGATRKVRSPRALAGAMRRARASVRVSTENERFYAGGGQAETTLADVRNAYRR